MQRASRPESVRIEAGREANDGQPGTPMRRNDPQDPELAQFRHRSAPIPRTAIFGGETGLLIEDVEEVRKGVRWPVAR